MNDSWQNECDLCGVKYELFNERHYCPREYRSGNFLEIWVGDQYGDPKRTWNVYLGWLPFRESPLQRITKVREKAKRLSDKLNHRELYMYHDLEISKR